MLKDSYTTQVLISSVRLADQKFKYALSVYQETIQQW
nr:hypothetical protein [Escherichia coli]